MNKIINYNIAKKELLINNAIFSQTNLIDNVKKEFPDDFKNRVSLEELKAINEAIYNLLEEINCIDNYLDYIDCLISTALFYSVNEGTFNIDVIKQSIFVINLSNMVLTSIQLSKSGEQIDNELKKIKKTEIIKFI